MVYELEYVFTATFRGPREEEMSRILPNTHLMSHGLETTARQQTLRKEMVISLAKA